MRSQIVPATFSQQAGCQKRKYIRQNARFHATKEILKLIVILKVFKHLIFFGQGIYPSYIPWYIKGNRFKHEICSITNASLALVHKNQSKVRIQNSFGNLNLKSFRKCNHGQIPEVPSVLLCIQ